MFDIRVIKYVDCIINLLIFVFFVGLLIWNSIQLFMFTRFLFGSWSYSHGVLLFVVPLQLFIDLLDILHSLSNFIL